MVSLPMWGGFTVRLGPVGAVVKPYRIVGVAFELYDKHGANAHGEWLAAHQSRRAVAPVTQGSVIAGQGGDVHIRGESGAGAAQVFSIGGTLDGSRSDTLARESARRLAA
jgi:hypothetical protein